MTETTITDVSKGRSGYGSAPLTVAVYNFDPSLRRKGIPASNPWLKF